MKTCFVALCTECDVYDKTAVIGVFSSRKNALAGIKKWKRNRRLRPTHMIWIETYPLDKEGPVFVEITKPFARNLPTYAFAVLPQYLSKDYTVKSPCQRFSFVRETVTDGWFFCAITKYENPDGCDEGDGFVVAPDGSCAGLDWRVGHDKIRQVAPPDKRKWGVYEVCFPAPVRTTADLVKHFRAVLPQIKKAYQSIHNAAVRKPTTSTWPP